MASAIEFGTSTRLIRRLAIPKLVTKLAAISMKRFMMLLLRLVRGVRYANGPISCSEAGGPAV